MRPRSSNGPGRIPFLSPSGDPGAADDRGLLESLRRSVPYEPPVRQAWLVPTWRDRAGRSRLWRSCAPYLSGRRINDWDALRRRLGNPRSVLCLGNGPSSEDPGLEGLGHDCLMRVNWRWKDRGFLPDPDVVFVGDAATLHRLSPRVFGLWNIPLEYGMLLRYLVTHGPRRMEYFTMERISPLVRDRYWPARPSNGALMVAAAAALRPERLTIAGIDLFKHPDGRYPGDTRSLNEYSRVHTRDVDVAIIDLALKDYPGRARHLRRYAPPGPGGGTVREGLDARREAPGPRPMKARTIVVVLDRFDPLYGGLESWADQWTRWLAGRGHDVHVAAFAIAPDSAGPGVVPHVLPGASGRLARAAEAERFLRRMGPDIIHDLGVGWHYDILQLHAGSRLANARQDLLSLGGPARLKRRFSPWHIRRDREFRALEKRQFGPGRGIVIAVSRMVQDDLRRRYGLDPGRIRLVYNGVDQRRLAGLDARRCREDLRSSLGLSDETLFLFIAHNFRLKGLGPSLKALSLLKGAGRSCHLAIVGRGPREEYQALARRLGVSDRVSFHGQVRDVRPFFNGADVFVLPTFHDACSLVVGEAWASGLPVITSRFNGAAELMTSGVHGWIIDDPRDARELARRMGSLLDPGPREAMSAAARELGSGLSQESNFARIEEIIDEAHRDGRS